MKLLTILLGLIVVLTVFACQTKAEPEPEPQPGIGKFFKKAIKKAVPQVKKAVKKATPIVKKTVKKTIKNAAPVVKKVVKDIVENPQLQEAVVGLAVEKGLELLGKTPEPEETEDFVGTQTVEMPTE